MRSGNRKPAHGGKGKVSGSIQEVNLDKSAPDVVVPGIEIFHSLLVVRPEGVEQEAFQDGGFPNSSRTEKHDTISMVCVRHNDQIKITN